jgi:hypothetical protein
MNVIYSLKLNKQLSKKIMPAELHIVLSKDAIMNAKRNFVNYL